MAEAPPTPPPHGGDPFATVQGRRPVAITVEGTAEEPVDPNESDEVTYLSTRHTHAIPRGSAVNALANTHRETRNARAAPVAAGYPAMVNPLDNTHRETRNARAAPATPGSPAMDPPAGKSCPSGGPKKRKVERGPEPGNQSFLQKAIDTSNGCGSLCPLELAPPVEAVVMPDGHTYELAAIKHAMGGKAGPSPITKEWMQFNPVPNYAVRTMVEELHKRKLYSKTDSDNYERKLVLAEKITKAKAGKFGRNQEKALLELALGYMHGAEAQSHGVPESECPAYADLEEACFWARKAHLLGNPIGTYYYGWCQIKSQGRNGSPQDGCVNIAHAAGKGVRQASWFLAICHHEGTGGFAAHPDQALVYLREALLKPKKKGYGLCEEKEAQAKEMLQEIQDGSSLA